MHIIYLHGFCSSTQSFKAQLVKDYIERHSKHSVYLIDLPYSPEMAMRLVESHITSLRNTEWGIIGSSLGGYYATYLSEKYQVKGVLINPAVQAFSLLTPLLGENKNYHSEEVFEFTRKHLEELKALYVPIISNQEKLLLLTQTGDEVLDYKDGVEYYSKAKQIIIEGGNHGFDDYADYLDQTFTHLIG